MGVAGDTCFDLQKPIVGKPAGRVCISPFGEIRVEHRQLKVPVVFSADRVQAIIDTSSTLEVEVPALEREPLAIHLPRDGFTPANFGFVFRAPILVGPFKYGAQQLIPLSRSQRRNGIEVDLLSLTVAEPELLVAALHAVGVAPTSDVGDALARSIPPVPPELEAEVFETRRRRERRAAWKVLGVGLLFAALTAARVAAEISWETTSRLALASVAAATLAGMAIAVTRPNPQPGPIARWAARIGFGLALLTLFGAALGAQDQVAGARFILLWSTFAGLLAAPVIGRGLRALAGTEPRPPEGDPVVPRRRRGWREALAIACIAVVAIAGSAVIEESAAQPVRDVQSALLHQDDLPDGWESCCGGDGIFRGDSLDEHICGSDDDALPAHVAAVKRSFNKPEVGHPEYSDGHIDMTVLLAPTVADAEAEFASVDAPYNRRCTRTTATQLGQSFQPAATGPATGTYINRAVASAPGQIIVDHIEVSIPVGSDVDVQHVYFVRARVGRAILRMPILVFSPSVFGDEERQAIIQAALAQVRSADL